LLRSNHGKKIVKNIKFLLTVAGLLALGSVANAQTNATQIVDQASTVMTAVIAVVGPATLFFIGLAIAKKLRRA